MNSIVYSFFFAMFLVYLAEAKQQTPLPSSITPALITADQITYDQDVSVTTARGHVEVLLYDQNKRQNLVLLADTISYHAKYDLIIATGNISLLEAGGLVIFAEYLELQRDFKSWVAQQIRVLFTNFSRISATVGIYNADSTYNLKQVAYTTCRLCDSTNLPWEINANSVSYNIKQHEVIYRDAWVKILGLPVVYVPYLSHTDQMSKYHSGFLIPHLGRTPNLGPIIRIPYFLDLSPNSNLTIEVLLSRRDMPVFSGVYHHNMQNSETKNQLSITHSKQGYIDGHVIVFSL